MENGNYSVFRVNYSDYLKSLHGLSVNRVPMAFRKVFPEKFSTRELDNESVFTRIRHYLNSENDFDHNQAEAIYGMNAWRHLSEKSVEISVEDLDPRAYRLFWEHKIIMLLRLMNSINVMRFKSQFDCINQYRKEVVERAHSVYLLSIKSKLAPNKQNNQSISSIIKQVCDAETTILASAIQ
ncbi:MAG: hypothetical protein IJR83_07065 [Clostridia bacterium]|nr:hypothetical protein [Clostridia bacterium]